MVINDNNYKNNNNTNTNTNKNKMKKMMEKDIVSKKIPVLKYF
jgi:hypothetical protein